MKIIQGACFRPCSKRSRTRLAPTPTNISTKSEPDIWKNGTFASPAVAFAMSVLPVPGIPTRRTPLGILAPIFRNLLGFLRKSTTSISSYLASFCPATSSKVIFLLESLYIFARLFPKLNALLLPCTCFIIIHIMIKPNIHGVSSNSIWKGLVPLIAPVTLTPFSSSLAISSASK